MFLRVDVVDDVEAVIFVREVCVRAQMKTDKQMKLSSVGILAFLSVILSFLD